MANPFTKIIVFCAFTFTMILRLDSLNYSNASDCGPSQYRSEDGDCMPCSQVCSTNQKKSHKDMCTFLCPNFTGNVVITSSPQTSPVVKRDVSINAVRNSYYDTIVAVICVIVVVVLCIFFILMRERCRHLCRRTTKNIPELLSIAVQETHGQETQSLSNTESDEEKEDSISIESIGKTSTLTEV